MKVNHRFTNIRKNYLHQTTSEIVNRKPRFICIEDLNVSGMMKNKHLFKAVQNQGIFELRKQLEYKCSNKGIQLIVADRFYPSSKLCSSCDGIKQDLKLSDRIYRCECRNIIERDFRASVNLKAYGEKSASWHKTQMQICTDSFIRNLRLWRVQGSVSRWILVSSKAYS